MLALFVVEAEPRANASPGLDNAGIGVEVDLLVFKAPPQSLDKDVVHAASLAIHAGGDGVALQSAGELVAGEPESSPNSASRSPLPTVRWREGFILGSR